MHWCMRHVLCGVRSGVMCYTQYYRTIYTLVYNACVHHLVYGGVHSPTIRGSVHLYINEYQLADGNDGV